MPNYSRVSQRNRRTSRRSAGARARRNGTRGYSGVGPGDKLSPPWTNPGTGGDPQPHVSAHEAAMYHGLISRWSELQG